MDRKTSIATSRVVKCILVSFIICSTIVFTLPERVFAQSVGVSSTYPRPVPSPEAPEGAEAYLGFPNRFYSPSVDGEMMIAADSITDAVYLCQRDAAHSFCVNSMPGCKRYAGAYYSWHWNGSSRVYPWSGSACAPTAEPGVYHCNCSGQWDEILCYATEYVGDATGNCELDQDDASAIVEYLFMGKSFPDFGGVRRLGSATSEGIGDWNQDGVLDISDAISLGASLAH